MGCGSSSTLEKENYRNFSSSSTLNEGGNNGIKNPKNGKDVFSRGKCIILKREGK